MPIAIQIPSRSQLSTGSEPINRIHTITHNTGINGTNGVLNGRYAFGSVFLNITTPIHTREKANRAPILTICPRSEMGTKPANALTNIINIKLVFQGVCFLDRSENNFGSSPSLLIL